MRYYFPLWVYLEAVPDPKSPKILNPKEERLNPKNLNPEKQEKDIN